MILDDLSLSSAHFHQEGDHVFETFFDQVDELDHILVPSGNIEDESYREFLCDIADDEEGY